MPKSQQTLKSLAACRNIRVGNPGDYRWRWDCNPLSEVTLKIERYCHGRGTTIRLIGRIQAGHLEELERQIREGGSNVALDLEDVNLVDVQVVRFLGACEAQGVRLLNGSPYISDWIAKERI